MLSLDDLRWNSFWGGYCTPYDPRPAFLKLKAGTDLGATWHELWNELHHQGDVDCASYAAVPFLVRIYLDQPTGDWNTYAIVTTIELRRKQGKNPDVPSWLADDYFSAIQELAKIGLSEITPASDPESVRAILGTIALAKGARAHARFLLEYSEEEVLELEENGQDRWQKPI